MILLEINEFNPDLMRNAANQLGGNGLLNMLALRETATITEDLEERYGLDPWVQWVSIHTGKKSSKHKVKHLADLSSLSYSQLWEVLGSQGVRCGVWGAMNAAYGDGKNMDFFFPDPWSFEQKAYPDYLNDLLAFPTHYAKNYGDIDKKIALWSFFRLIKFSLRISTIKALLPIFPVISFNLIKHGFKNHILFALFDLVNVALFVGHYKKYKPEFNVLFLNSLAHLQHHKWTSNTTPLNDDLLAVFSIFNKAISLLLDSVPEEESIVITNAFTQECSYDRNEFLYRQINPDLFLKKAGIAYSSVEQLMTNDAHVFFENRESVIKAIDILKGTKVNDQEVFYVEYSEDMPLQIFFQVSYWKSLDDNVQLFVNGRAIKFFDVFEKITQRSGSHIPQGHIFSSHIEFPAEIDNHKIFDYVIDSFGVKK